MKTLVLVPVMSEKAYNLSKAKDTYVFSVPKNVAKQTVAQAVKDQFGVEVVSVNVANLSGKPKRTVYKRSRAVTGNRNDIKKAYVRLKKGNVIPVFAAVEEAQEQEAKTQAKLAKASSKEKKQ